MARWRRVIRPSSSPVATLKAAYRFAGPCRLEVVGAARDLSGPQREHRMGPVERLDLRLLVDREHQRVVGRVEVEPDDVDDFLGELRIPTELEGLEPMRLEVGGLPDLPHLPLRDAGVARHQPRAPMGSTGTRSVVSSRMRSTVRRLSTVGRPDRGRSTNPASPSAP